MLPRAKTRTARLALDSKVRMLAMGLKCVAWERCCDEWLRVVSRGVCFNLRAMLKLIKK